MQNVAGGLGSTMQLWSLGKRFVSKHCVLILWEAVYDWRSASGEITASTRESGSTIIQSVILESAAPPISVLEAFVQITRSDSDQMDLIQQLLESGSLTKIVLPSLPQVMVDRAQQVENHLIDKLS